MRRRASLTRRGREFPGRHAALALRSEATLVRKPHPLLREAGLSPLPGGRTRSAGRVRQKIRGEGQKKLVVAVRNPYIAFTQFARACGRVSVGGHPDKRPDSRQVLETDGGGWISPQITLPVPPQGNCHRTATGSRRRNRRTPNLHGGRSLKQRRNGLFLVSLVLQRPAPKRLVLHCRACGVSPSDGYQSPNLVVRLFLASPSRLESPTAQPASCRIGAACAGGAASHDRAHP